MTTPGSPGQPDLPLPGPSILAGGAPTSFVGRGREIATIRRLLGHYRVVTLTGPGGVGKTRLLTQLAGELAGPGDFPDGVVVVGLGDLRASDDWLAETVAHRVGLANNAAEDPALRLVRHFEGRRALLMLDNCEHLLGEVGEGPVPRLVNTLLAGATTLRVMATSRMRLGVAGETPLDIPPLRTAALDPGTSVTDDDAHEALRLLIDRVTAVQGTIAAAEYPLAVTLCRRLDGLPLAIEIAAGLLEKDGMTLREIVEHPDLLRLLADGTSDLPHHRTMRATITWSYDLLREPEQRLFRLLAVFEGGFDIDAAREIASVFGLHPNEVQGLLGRLVRKSLLVGENRDGRTRYRLLGLIRHFGLQLCIDEDSWDALSEAHAHYYADLAARGHQFWFGSDEPQWMRRIVTDQPNFLAAQQRLLCTAETRARALDVGIDTVATRAYVFSGQLNDGLRLLARGLEGETDQRNPRRIIAMAISMWIAALQGNGSRAQSLLEQITTAARTQPRHDIIDGAVLYSRGSYLFLTQPRRARARESITLLARAETLLRRHGAAGDAFMAALFLAMATTFFDGRTAAFTQTARVLELARQRGAQWCMSWALWTRALAELLYGDLSEAARLAQQAQRIQRAIGDRWGGTWTGWLIALIAIKHGEYVVGAQLLGGAQARQQLTQTSVLGMPTFLRVQTTMEDLARSDLGAKFDHYVAEGKEMARVDSDKYFALAAQSLRWHPPRTPEHPRALTAREHQIAELIAEGHTNQQIADTLQISVRTVGTHVSNLNNKLHTTNRVEIGRWVRTNVSRVGSDDQSSSTGISA